MSEPKSYFLDRKTRLDGLSDEKRNALMEASSHAEDPEAWLDQRFASWYIAKRHGFDVKKVRENFPSYAKAAKFEDTNPTAVYNTISNWYNQQKDNVVKPKYKRKDAKWLASQTARTALTGYNEDFVLGGLAGLSGVVAQGGAKIRDAFGMEQLPEGENFFLDMQKLLLDSREGMSEHLGVDPEFEQKLIGQVARGGGQLAGMLMSGPFSLPAIGGMMYQEGYDDYMQTQERKGLEADPNDAFAYASTYMIAGTALERFGINTLIGTIFKKKGRMTWKTALKEIIKAATSEGGTEAAQGFILDAMASVTYDDDRELFTAEAFKQRGMEFLVGAILSGGVSTVGQGYNLNQKRTLTENALRLGVNSPLSQEDFKVYKEHWKEDKVRQRIQDPTMQELFIRGMNGDMDAQNAYNAELVVKSPDFEADFEFGEGENKVIVGTWKGNKIVYDASGKSMRLNMDKEAHRNYLHHLEQAKAEEERIANLTDEERQELEAERERRKNLMGKRTKIVLMPDTGQPVPIGEAEATVKEDEEGGSYAIYDEDGGLIDRADTEEEAEKIALDWEMQEQDQLPIATEELAEFFRSMGRNVETHGKTKRTLKDEFEEGNISEKAAEEIIRSHGYTGDNVLGEMQNIYILGRDASGFVNNVWVDAAHIYNGATPFTVVEEMSEGYLKRMIHMDGEITLDQLREWKRQYEEFTGIVEYENTTRGMIEWFSNRSIDYVTMETLDGTQTMIPSSFKSFLIKLKLYLNHVMIRVNAMRKMKAEGKLDPELEMHLSRATLTDMRYVRDRMRRMEEEQINEELGRTEDNELMAHLRRISLPSPNSKAAKGDPLRAELRDLYDNWPTMGKNGRLKVFRKKGDSLDDVRQRLNEEGFRFETVNDLLDAITASLENFHGYEGAQGVYPETDGQVDPTYMTAFHGSPHSFDRFSLEKIGTGEGAQAYGWGLYFAGSKEVAEWYRDQLSHANGLIFNFGIPSSEVIQHLKEVRFATSTEAGFISMLKSLANSPVGQKSLDYVESGAVGWTKEKGKLYQVDLKPAEDEYLLWDKPLSEQSEKVREALKKRPRNTYDNWRKQLPNLPSSELIEVANNFDRNNTIDEEWDEDTTEQEKIADVLAFFDYIYQEDADGFVEYIEAEDYAGMNGGAMYRQIQNSLMSDREASLYLKSLGIRGIKYLDGSSRGKGEGNYNYVIFDEADIEIEDTFQAVRGVEQQLSMLGIPSDKAKLLISGEISAQKVVDDLLGVEFDANGNVDSADTIIVEENPDGTRDIGFDPTAGIASQIPRNFGEASHVDAIEMAREQAVSDINRILYGQPTFQAVQTDTPAFKAWFGDSKVVDENGEPLVVYHGTKIDGIDKFEAGEEGGIFFSNDQWDAETYGDKLHKVYLNISNPWEISWSDIFSEEGEVDPYGKNPWVLGFERIQEWGYDGIIIKADPELADRLDEHEIQYDQYIAFEPTQIKSATGNRGTFDPNDPRITFSAVPYNLTASPFIENYDGEKGEPVEELDFDSLHYHVTLPARKRIKEAIDSGAVRAASDNLVTEVREMLKIADVASGEGWYSRMRERIKKVHGEFSKLFTHLLGATSAQTPVDDNFTQAVEIITRYKRGEFDSKIKKYIEMRQLLERGELGDALVKRKIATKDQVKGKTEAALAGLWISHYDLLPKKATGALYNANSGAVLKALSGKWLEGKVTPKTPQFAMNLNGESLEATIDVWAARTLRRLLWGDENRIQPSDEQGVSDEDFALGQIIFREAAKKLGYNPDDLQAIVWFGEKHIWDMNGWTSKIGAKKSSFDEAAEAFYPVGRKARPYEHGKNVLKFMNKESAYLFDKETEGWFNSLDKKSKKYNNERTKRRKHEKEYLEAKSLPGVPAYIKTRGQGEADREFTGGLSSASNVPAGQSVGRGVQAGGAETFEAVRVSDVIQRPNKTRRQIERSAETSMAPITFQTVRKTLSEQTGIKPEDLYQSDQSATEPLDEAFHRLRKEQLQEILDRQPQAGRFTKVDEMDRSSDTYRKLNKVTDAVLAKRYLAPITSRLRRINPRLGSGLRKLERSINKRRQSDRMDVETYMKGTRRFSKDEKAEWILAVNNGDTATVNRINKKYGLEEEYEVVRKALKNIHDRAVKAGLEVGFRREYWPRIIKDLDGLQEFLYGDEKINGKIQEALMLAQANGPITQEDRIRIVNNLLIGYRPSGLNKPGNVKVRAIEELESGHLKFYHDPLHALNAYLDNMNEAIEVRKFFGKSAKMEELDQVNLDGSKDTVQKLDLDGSVGQMVLDLVESGKISYQQQEEVMSIYRSRFSYQATPKAWATARSLGYLTAMGQVSSAITQFGDFAWAGYEAGIFHTLAAASRATVGRSKITREDVGIELIAQEFSTMGRLNKALDFVLTYSGLKYIDRVGKETLINASISRLQERAKAGVLSARDSSRLNAIFGEEAPQVMADLAAGEINENILLLAHNILLDYQPVSLSEMPQVYLDNPRGRVFYQLKTFTVKQLDAFRREGIDEIAKGNVRRGITQLVKLMGFFYLANFPVDWIKDWLYGREPDMTDVMVDNLWKLGGLSRYNLYFARENPNFMAAAKIIMPPAPYIEYPLNDAFKAYDQMSKGEDFEISKMESWKMVPWFGKFYYWHEGKGADKIEKKRQRKLRE